MAEFNFQSKFSEFKELFSNRKTVVSAVILIILILGLAVGLYLIKNPQIFKSRATEKKGNTTLENAKFQGYIIEFKDAPAIEKSKGMNKFFPTEINGKGKISPQSVEDYSQNTLKPAHDTAKRDIFERLRAPSPQGLPAGQLALLGEYFNTFNGIALDITAEQAEKVKQSPFVKAVYPNLEVQASLNDSVPLIGADKVWGLTDNKGEKITGKGVKVAVLDTGVDYTHLDLGATSITERDFQKIASSSTAVVSMALTPNKLVYSAGHKIYLYSFDNQQQIVVDAFSDDLWVGKVAFDGRYLVYYAYFIDWDRIDRDYQNPEKYIKSALYIYDLQTGSHKKMVDAQGIGSIYIKDGKVIYGRNANRNFDGNYFGPYIYEYDIAAEAETSFAAVPEFTSSFESIVFKMSGDQIAIYAPGSSTQPKKYIIYNLVTREKKELTPTDAGEILDFKGSKILYMEDKGCGSSCKWDTYYLYDIATGESIKLHYDSPSVPARAVNQQSKFGLLNMYNPDPDGKLSAKYFYLMTWFSLPFASIGERVIYFDRAVYRGKIIGYDLTSQRYSLINLLKRIGRIEAQGDKVCFYSEMAIYCHDYDSQNPYELPTGIFNNKVVSGHNFIDNDDNPLDDHGHGTHVSAIVAGNGFLKGIAPGAQIIAYKVLDNFGSGYFSDVIAAIEKSVDTRLDNDSQNDIDIISMSLGADCARNYTPVCGPDDPPSKAVDNAVDAGIVVVVAAGNSGPSASTVGSPGTARKAITVGAVDKSKQIASFSSRGPVVYNGETINKPDIVAPGVSICAAEYDGFARDRRCIDDKHTAISGTSMATPHVAGLAALLKQGHPEWSSLQIKTAIVSTAEDLGLPRDSQGAGLVNAMAALSAPVATPGSSPSPSPTPFVCTACAADIKKDARNMVNASDYAILSSCFGKSLDYKLSNGISCAVADINKDGSINQADDDCLKSVYFQKC